MDFVKNAMGGGNKDGATNSNAGDAQKEDYVDKGKIHSLSSLDQCTDLTSLLCHQQEGWHQHLPRQPGEDYRLWPQRLREADWVSDAR